jgi:leucyl aminopeptidase (aminopeptidase T)
MFEIFLQALSSHEPKSKYKVIQGSQDVVLDTIHQHLYKKYPSLYDAMFALWASIMDKATELEENNPDAVELRKKFNKTLRKPIL